MAASWVVLSLILIGVGCQFDCLDLNVRCVSSAHFLNITAAVAACGSADPCIVMISSDLSPYDEKVIVDFPGSSSSSTPGEILPFPNEDIVWFCSAFPWPMNLVFTDDAEHWKVHGGNNGTITLQTDDSSAIHMDTVNPGMHTTFHFGPGLVIENYLPASPSYGIRIALTTMGCHWDDVVVDGVRFVGDGTFYETLNFQEPPELLPSPTNPENYRLIIRNVEIPPGFTQVSGVLVQSVPDVLVEHNNWYIRQSFMVVLHDSPRFDIWNNIFQFDADTVGLDIYSHSGQNVMEDVTFVHNTIRCPALAAPVSVFLYLNGDSEVATDPQSIVFSNNLVLGHCTGLPEGFFYDTSCSISTCFGDVQSSFQCNLVTDSTALSGFGGPFVVWDMSAVNGCDAFDSPADVTDPVVGGDYSSISHFMPVSSYPGVDLRSRVPMDYFGRTRDVSTAGAFEYYECDNVPFFNDSATVCYGRGECVGSGICDCDGIYDADTFCETELVFYMCNNVSGLDVDNVCFGNGQCIGTDTCDCEGNYDPILFCETEIAVYMCNNVSGADVDNVCSGNGRCIGTDLCDCEGDYDPILFCAGTSGATWYAVLGGVLGGLVGVAVILVIVAVIVVVIICAKRPKAVGTDTVPHVAEAVAMDEFEKPDKSDSSSSSSSD